MVLDIYWIRFMFREARLRLTAWYVLAIMLVSISFSAIIYRSWSMEMERFAMAQKVRLERRMMVPVVIDDDVMEEAKKRAFFNLVIVDSLLWLLGAGGGYFLAGKTLGPIEESLEEQRRFINDAGHELKTPLTALKTNLEVYLRGWEKTSKEEVREVIEGSLSDVDRLQKLTESLLFLGKLENKKNAAENKAILVAKNIDMAMESIAPLAKKKLITISRTKSSSKVYWNPDDMKRALIILLDNAIKYSPKKSKVRIKIKGKTNSVVIMITDQGMGIAKDQAEKIFERFYRIDSSRSGNSGFGLGLPIAKRLIESANGKIWFESKLKEGSTFYMQLPKG